MADTRTKLEAQGHRITARMRRTRDLLADARTATEEAVILRRYDALKADRRAVIRQLIELEAAARPSVGPVGTVDVSGAGDAAVRRVRGVRAVFGGRP